MSGEKHGMLGLFGPLVGLRPFLRVDWEELRPKQNEHVHLAGGGLFEIFQPNLFLVQELASCAVVGTIRRSWDSRQ